MKGANKTLLFCLNIKRIPSLLENIRHFWPLMEENPNHSDLLKSIKNTKLIFNALLLSTLFGLFFYIIRPPINEQYLIAFFCYVPSFMSARSVMLIEDYVMIYISIGALAIGFFVNSICVLLRVQFKLLNSKLRSFDWKSEEELKICIQHHTFLLKYVS